VWIPIVHALANYLLLLGCIGYSAGQIASMPIVYNTSNVKLLRVPGYKATFIVTVVSALIGLSVVLALSVLETTNSDYGRWIQVAYAGLFGTSALVVLYMSHGFTQRLAIHLQVMYEPQEQELLTVKRLSRLSQCIAYSVFIKASVHLLWAIVRDAYIFAVVQDMLLNVLIIVPAAYYIWVLSVVSVRSVVEEPLTQRENRISLSLLVQPPASTPKTAESALYAFI
jgi:hypothetical protein